jgi:hypothetical protein
LESARGTFEGGCIMKVGTLKEIIENNCLEDEAHIKFSGVRDGKTFEGYEVWTTEDDSGRETIHISIASEGDSDFERVQKWKNSEMMKEYASKIHDSLERVTWDLDEEDSDIERLMDDLYNENYVDMEDLILMNTEAKVLINKYEKETA